MTFRPRLSTRRSSVAVLSLFSLTAIAAACSTDSTHPSLVGIGEQPSEGGHPGSSSSAGRNSDSAGASGEDGGDAGATGANGGTGGRATDSGNLGGALPSVPPACNREAVWSSPKSVAGVSSTSTELLLALTADELDLAFLREGALYVAHRTTPDATFTVGSKVMIPSGWSAKHGAALSADGKRLVLVSDPDQKRLGELTRKGREAPFTGEVDTSAFALVNEDSLFSGRIYASPTVSVGDDQLFFNSSFDDDSTVVVSTRSPLAAWSAPSTLSAGVFDGAAGHRRLPTGVAADGRTLFYFNEESGEEEARWRDTNSADSPLYDMQSLGMRSGAAPNSACNRLYSESTNDVVVEQD